jgi:hypothetical protein
LMKPTSFVRDVSVTIDEGYIVRERRVCHH